MEVENQYRTLMGAALKP
uniref:Uncharacterized protein n=1 Tax=Nymphaea colorata TaxID=210225 RepID=A0A5K1AG99_9MAGN